MPRPGPLAISTRAVRRMRDRLVRGGVVLDDRQAAAAAETLSAPGDRPAMLLSVQALRGSLAAEGRRCAPDLLLEAAAALRGHRDWNTLAASLPREPAPAVPGVPTGPAPGEAVAWLVHHVHHRGPFPLATGPFPDLASAEEEMDGYTGLHDSHSYRLVRWTGPEAELRDATRVYRPGVLLRAAEQCRGRIEVLRERSGAAEARGESYVAALGAALAEFDMPAVSLHRTAHPVLGPVVRQLRVCTCVDEASAALSAAADRQEAEAVRLRPFPGSGLVGEYRDACVLMGALRTAASRVWRLDSQELRQNLGMAPR